MEIPERLRAVYEQLRMGHFKSGIETLRRLYDWKRPLDRILMAEFKLRTGDWQESEGLTQELIDGRSTPHEVRARAYEHLALHSRLRGNLPDPIELLERSFHIATKHSLLEQTCRTQIALLSAKGDVYGLAGLGTLPGDVSLNVMRSGDPHLRLWLHLRLAEMAAKKGAFTEAERHLALTATILSRYSDLWVESRLNLIRGAAAETVANLDSALRYTNRALELARQSGSVFDEGAALCNLGHLYITIDRLTEARACLDQARHITAKIPSLQTALLDNLAIIELRQANFDAAASLLRKAKVMAHGTRYADIENNLTAVQLLRKQGLFDEALKLAKSFQAVSSERRTSVLSTRYLLLEAELLLDMGQLDAAREAFEQIEAVDQTSLKLLADLERVRGRISARSNEFRRARVQLRRSARIFHRLGHVAAHREATELIKNEAREDLGPHRERRKPTTTAAILSFVSGVRVLQFADNPLLLGDEVIALARHIDTKLQAAIIAWRDERREVVRHINWPNAEGSDASAGVTRIQLGANDRDKYEFVMKASREHAVDEVFNAVATLVTKAVELAQLARERAERTTLWPIEIVLSDSGPLFYSEKMRELRQQAMRMASTDMKVLITGETGVGKEVIARLIHDSSKRAAKQFDAVNCSSLPRELFEDQLFGHKKGAFTGAISDSLGILRANAGGTVFFDEIGELSLDAQVKLLRVIDRGEVQPLGAPRTMSVDFRVIAATNANLRQLMEEKRFRDDLFYRLNVGTLRVPPLRERREEILPLAQHFLSFYCTQNDRPLLTLSDEAQEHLLLYDWPGNVRQLKNEMERLAGMIEPGSRIKASDLTDEIRAARYSKPIQEIAPNEIVVRIDQKLDDAFDLIVRHAVPAALQRNNNVCAAAAKDLGITRKGLYNKRIKLGMIPRPPSKPVKRRASKKAATKRRPSPAKSRRSPKAKSRPVARVNRRAKGARRRG